jgi:thiamine-phosphate diphosphorylase
MALDAGCRLFQYRDKINDRRTIYDTSLRIARMVRNAGAVFLVNDHADVALAADADGVHLGQTDLPPEHARNLLGTKKLIGISTHTMEQAVAAQAADADYIGFGPLFATRTKDAGPVQGIENLRDIRAVVSIPIIAIGGITTINAPDAITAGADGVAVISAVWGAPNRTAMIRDFLAVMRSSCEKGRDR